MGKLRGFEICKGYEGNGLKIPTRATERSAGYDMESAFDVDILPSFVVKTDSTLGVSLQINKPVLVKTGIKAYMNEGEFVMLANRSGGNSLGILDGDYADNISNDGDIMFQFYNFGNETIHIKKGEAIGQAVFTTYNKTDNDIPNNVKRQGGFNSTGN